jgi:hypothetical protein
MYCHKPLHFVIELRSYNRYTVLLETAPHELQRTGGFYGG